MGMMYADALWRAVADWLLMGAQCLRGGTREVWLQFVTIIQSSLDAWSKQNPVPEQLKLHTHTFRIDL
jgi:hypothetical protein